MPRIRASLLTTAQIDPISFISAARPSYCYLIFFSVRPFISSNYLPQPSLPLVSIATPSIELIHLRVAFSLVLASALPTILTMDFLTASFVVAMVSSLASLAGASPRGMQMQLMISLPARLERYTSKELDGLTSRLGNNIVRRIYGTSIIRSDLLRNSSFYLQ